MWTCVSVCTQIHTQAHAHLYKSWLCQNLLVVSCRQDSRSCVEWQWWRKWAKITRAIPETFQSKDVPACLTLQQFNTVFRSNVVIVLSFSLYTVILNDRVEERITGENVFFLLACVSLCLCGHYVPVVMHVYVCTCSCVAVPQYSKHTQTCTAHCIYNIVYCITGDLQNKYKLEIIRGPEGYFPYLNFSACYKMIGWWEPSLPLENQSYAWSYEGSFNSAYTVIVWLWQGTHCATTLVLTPNKN